MKGRSDGPFVLIMSRKKVLVAMSGGVDSSVTALLLKEQGYDVVGLYMKLWTGTEPDGDARSGGSDSINDCRFVCDRIAAPFYVQDLSGLFREEIIENFVAEYKAGRTPNPCVRCNSEIKWKGLLDKASEIGCDFVATGHFAFVEHNRQGRWYVRRGDDRSRDQSYVLWRLSQEALSRTLMPLGGVNKDEVREIARRNRLETAEKKESREICFVVDDDYRRFLRQWEERKGGAPEPGEIVHVDGRVLGRHEGTAFYTVGQRRGLGVANPVPLYVQRIDVANNRVIVGGEDTLYRSELTVERVRWQAMVPNAQPFEAAVKIRYRHSAARACVRPVSESCVHVIFEEKQRAVTPGQSAVFYDGDILIGGGIIAEDMPCVGGQHSR